MRAIFYIVLLSVVFLTACGTTPPATEAEVPQAVELEETPRPTKTIRPTSTKRPRRTPVNSTPTLPSGTATAKAEQKIQATTYATMSAPFTECRYVASFLKSPDSYWTAAQCELDILLQGQNGEMIALPPESYAMFFPSGVVYPELRAKAEHWTADSKFFYFSADAYLGDGCGCFCYRDGAALFRLEMSSAKITPVLVYQGKRTGTYSFSFSPNGRRLAYVSNWENKLVIRDLQTGEENSIDFSQYTETGNLVWSPDSQKLAFGLASCPDTSYPTFKLGLIKLGKEPALNILIAKTGEVKWDDFFWYVRSWKDENTILIQNPYYNTSEEVKYIDPTP